MQVYTQTLHSHLAKLIIMIYIYIYIGSIVMGSVEMAYRHSEICDCRDTVEDRLLTTSLQIIVWLNKGFQSWACGLLPKEILVPVQYIQINTYPFISIFSNKCRELQSLCCRWLRTGEILNDSGCFFNCWEKKGNRFGSICLSSLSLQATFSQNLANSDFLVRIFLYLSKCVKISQNPGQNFILLLIFIN